MLLAMLALASRVEIDDLDADPKLTPSAQKLYGLIVMNPLVGFGSFSDASQVGRHVAKGGLSVKDLAAFKGAVTLPKNTLIVGAGKVRMADSENAGERAEGSASEFLVVSGPYKRLLVWIPVWWRITDFPEKSQFATHRPIVCRMFNRAITKQTPPQYLSSDHDPLFRFHR